MTSLVFSGNRLAHFMLQIVRPTPKPILKTPAKKISNAQDMAPPAVRGSGRLAIKAHTKGKKTSEELAQDILRKKLDGTTGETNQNDKARAQLSCLFNASLPEESVEAIEELLNVISLGGKKAVVQQRQQHRSKRPDAWLHQVELCFTMY
jgi:hypothetical protein